MTDPHEKVVESVWHLWEQPIGHFVCQADRCDEKAYYMIVWLPVLSGRSGPTYSCAKHLENLRQS